MALNIPNMLTVARIALIPILVSLIYLPNAWIASTSSQYLATGIFVLAAITDWLDGYLARRLNQTTAFGAFADPVADKLIVCASLIVLVHIGRLHSVIAIIILSREIAISALREWMAQVGETKSVAVAFVGKLKTATQMTAIPFLLIDAKPFNLVNTRDIGTVLIWAAAVLTVWSGAHYMKVALETMARRDKQQTRNRRLPVKAQAEVA